MIWDVAISNVATMVTDTVLSTPFVRYLAMLGGAMWLMERFRPINPKADEDLNPEPGPIKTKRVTSEKQRL
jgi:hypothetical protein